MDFIHKFRSDVEKKNLLATVIPVLAFLWFLLLSYESGRKCYYSFTWMIVFSCAFASLCGSVGIMVNRGTAAFVPLVFTFPMAAIGLYYRDIDIFWDVVGWVSVPYFMVLCAMLFKKNGVSAYNNMYFAGRKVNSVSNIWKQWNPIVTVIIGLSVLVAAFYSYVTVVPLLTSVMDQDSLMFAYSLWIMASFIGLSVICLGYRWGCGCVWFATLQFCVCALGVDHSLKSCLVLVPAAFIQALLMIKKKGKTAFSVMK